MKFPPTSTLPLSQGEKYEIIKASYLLFHEHLQKVKCQQKSLFSMLQLMANNRNKHLQPFYTQNLQKFSDNLL